MTKETENNLFIITAIVCFLLVFYQYNSDKEKHETLLKIGQKSKIIAEPFQYLATNHAYYYFITKNAQKIEGREKCDDFNKYKSAFAIYNPKNPSEHELSFNFYEYSKTWRVIFFFFTYLPLMTYINFSFVKFCVSGYLNYKANKKSL